MKKQSIIHILCTSGKQLEMQITAAYDRNAGTFLTLYLNRRHGNVRMDLGKMF